MYEVTIITDTEVVNTIINDLTELHDLLLKYDYTGVEVKKRVRKLVK